MCFVFMFLLMDWLMCLCNLKINCVHNLADVLVEVLMQSEDQLCSYLADVLLMIMNTINDC
jgi:hypothetical protein